MVLCDENFIDNHERPLKKEKEKHLILQKKYNQKILFLYQKRDIELTFKEYLRTSFLSLNGPFFPTNCR